MSESVSLPALGESVTEGTVTRWLKNVGDRVEVDEPLLEVSTDKVDTEIPSPVAGVIEKILVEEDETVEVGTDLVVIGDGSGSADASGDDAPAEDAPAEETAPAETPSPADETPDQTSREQEEETPADSDAAPASEAEEIAQESVSEGVDEADGAEETDAQESAPAPVPAAAPAAVPAAPAPAAAAPAAAPSESASSDSSAGPSYVTPLVRRLANDKGVDLASVTGTGVGGRIRKEDVLAAAESASAPAAASTTSSAAAPTVEISPLRGTTQPMSRLRKVVAQRAVASMQATAQLTTVVEVDVTKVAAFRQKVKDRFLEKTGVKLSFLPFFALAAAEALRTYPVINATVDGDQIVYPDHENISIAVDTERGLLTPVVKNAADLDLAGFAAQIADLAERTRDNKLKPDELAGGTFTLTNTGSRGALFDTPLVFQPQSAILGTGIVAKKPVVISADGSDSIAIRSTVYLALSYDHRIVDGADAARFLVAVKNRLEGGAFEGSLGI
jgi:pyruvate dehydrogenase E2 component (dihydrolipoamide acetyltransferase)